MYSIKSSKGSTALTTPIVIAISMFLIALLIVFVVNMLMPFIWYEKLSLQSLKYIFVMEEYGYLTPAERINIVNELKTQNFDVTKIDIVATDAPVGYGEPIFLNITYDYSYSIPVLNPGTLSTINENRELQMILRRQSISKR